MGLCGRVFWITGLAGAGKTTIGTLLYEHLRKRTSSVVFLDGDRLRKVFGGDLGYTREDRHVGAMRNARLCQMLAEEGLDVVCCTISMFADVRAWNREHISGYFEIYLKVADEVLLQRNQKGLYDTERGNLVGFGIGMEEPSNPDMVFVNDGTRQPLEIVDDILEAVSG